MRIARPVYVVILTTLLYAGYVIVAFGSPLALVTPGVDFSPDEAFHYPNEGEGYDGQFVYYIARDPANAAPLIDVPAYRYQRILLPALGWLLALGQAPLLPYTLLAANLIVLSVGMILLEQMLAAMGVSRWYALGYGLSLAGLGAVRLTLPEPLAYGLCIVGAWFLFRDSIAFAALAFAAAALAKETTLVFSAAVGLHLLLKRQIARATMFGIVVLMPFVVWQAVLNVWLGAFGVGSGGEGATGFEFIPFMGALRILGAGNLLAGLALLVLIIPAVVLPTIWGLWRGWRDWRGGTWTWFTTLLVVNAGIMLFVPFSTYREPNAILRFIAGLQIALILYAAHRRNPVVLRYSTFWALTSLIPIMSDVALAGR